MVARIKFSASIRKPFHYNMQKLKEGNAKCLAAENIPMCTAENAELAIRFLEKQVGLLPDLKAKSVHISLNFSPDEQLSDDQMSLIAREYIEGIGFGQQPYLVYRHHDSGHPHCHIVTTNIRLDKSYISLHQIGKNVSEPVRKELETKYGLVRAEEQKKDQLRLKPITAEKVIYGKLDTKRAIGNILAEVIPNYKFTSLGELNAVLKLYNVLAEWGQEGSRINKNGGLLYRIINTKGQPVGVPIKASLFADKPTLNNLAKRFLTNDTYRFKFKNDVKTKIDLAIKFKKPDSLQKLQEQLKIQGLRLVPQVNEEGSIFGLTYVDLKSKCVFNGSALGKEYAAKRILERIHLPEKVNVNNAFASRKAYPQNEYSLNSQQKIPLEAYQKLDENSMLMLLMQYEFAASNVPYEWKKKKRKKNKR
ncbi:relaxase/mobilization nuclease domain-containing protein [Sphingobacterium siyangense]|uniref:relaxase/mobilization nuclease domain-containing protein n=1 Tax=Sphingobacterium siyangense TaxID=459529 RepID=UPI002FD9D9E3